MPYMEANGYLQTLLYFFTLDLEAHNFLQYNFLVIFFFFKADSRYQASCSLPIFTLELENWKINDHLKMYPRIARERTAFV